MNISVILTLVVCLLDLSVASERLRENSNVLVPNNDVNIHEKFKALGDEIDPEDFSDNEIESLSEMINTKVNKLSKQSANKVFDDKNRVIEENQIERDSLMMDAIDEGNFTTSFPSNWTTSTSDANLTWSSEPTFTVLPSTIASNSTPTTPSNKTWPATESTTPHYNFSESKSTNNDSIWATTQSFITSTYPANITTASNSSIPTNLTTPNNSTTSTTLETPVTSTTTISTTEEPIFDDLQSDECLLGKAERHLKWVIGDTGRLDSNVIKEVDGDVKFADLSWTFISYDHYISFATDTISIDSSNRTNFTDLKFLSAGYNHLLQLPSKLLGLSNTTLKYLSLIGNSLTNIEFDLMPNLAHLDLRRCGLKYIQTSQFRNLPNIEFLYLSNNFIADIEGHPFPSRIIHLDLAYNTELPLRGMEMLPNVFRDLNFLQTLDLSFTKIKTESVVALKALPRNLTRLSLCNTELPKISDRFIEGSENIKYLDISKNPLLELKPSMFSNFSDSLIVLFARESNVKNLDWAETLHNLKLLDLFDNNIHRVTSTSFLRMTSLTKLNLERNSIGNWHSRLFTQNQKLSILNLRENKLSLLTNDMKTDLSSVDFLAIGKNEFECNCVLQDFMHELFEKTRAANSSRFPSVEESDYFYEEAQELNEIPEDETTTRATLGFRQYQRPEYDVFSRTYKKYYEMAEASIKALKNRTSDDTSFSIGNLISRSSVGKVQTGKSPRTILFDYDNNDEDYRCMNASQSVEQPIIELSGLCDNVDDDKDGRSHSVMTTLWVSLVALFSTVIVLLLIYWKWWYIRYFFMLCRNSAILTFMDSDSESEKIIKGKSEDDVEIFAYDVFVSYSDQNRPWVLDEFIPNIEKRESINVCLHERDFQVGYGILENIVQCMDRSRCLLLLVSENFLLSQWCQFEMNLAQHRLLETRREKLILVLLEDIPVHKQPKTLKYLMRTKTYIKWPQNGLPDQKQLFWKRLKKAIISSQWENESYGSLA